MHAQNDRLCLGPIESCYSGPKDAVLHAKATGGVLNQQRLVILLLKSLVLPVVLCMQKQRLLDQHTSLYGCQTSPVVLCIQNRVISTRNTTFYGFQPSSVVLCNQNSALRSKIAYLYGSQPSCVVFECKTATFGLELQSSVGQRPHLLFLHAKLRLLDLNNKSLWVPDMTCHFVHVQQCA